MPASRKALAATGLALGLTLLPEIASAQPWPIYRGDRRYEDSTYDRRPRHGYSGWGSGPLHDYYCDYTRYPIRRCYNGRCRVVAWETRQYCY